MAILCSLTNCVCTGHVLFSGGRGLLDICTIKLFILLHHHHLLLLLLLHSVFQQASSSPVIRAQAVENLHGRLSFKLDRGGILCRWTVCAIRNLTKKVVAVFGGILEEWVWRLVLHLLLFGLLVVDEG
jgi:hypothetical protein